MLGSLRSKLSAEQGPGLLSSGISYILTYALAMASNQNHDYSLQVGSPPPTLACPFCPRHFKSKSGRTRHIQSIHPDNGSAPGTLAAASSTPQPPPHNSSPVPDHDHAPDTAADTSPTPPPPQPHPHDSSLSPVLSYDGFDANHSIDSDIDIEHPHPDTSRISRVFHAKLNGMSMFFYLYIDINFSICREDLRREWECLTT